MINKYAQRFVGIAAVALMLSVGGASLATADEGTDPAKVAEEPMAPEIVGEGGLEFPVCPEETASARDGGMSIACDTNGAASAWLRGSRGWTISPGASTSSLTGSFESYAAWNAWDTKVKFSNGWSKMRWYGASPRNATNMKLQDKLWVTAVTNVSIEAGSWGGSATIGGKSLTLTSSHNNTWKVDHTFSGQSFAGPLFTVGQQANLTATFGTHTYYYTVS